MIRRLMHNRRAAGSAILMMAAVASPLHAQEQGAGLVHRCVKDGALAEVAVVPERHKGELPCLVMFEAEGVTPEKLWRV